MSNNGDPTLWSMNTWLLALVMSLMGGIINWLSHSPFKDKSSLSTLITSLIAEMATSGFVGIGAFMALLALDFDAGICAAAAGVSGHFAARMLFLIERKIEEKIDKL